MARVVLDVFFKVVERLSVGEMCVRVVGVLVCVLCVFV